MSRKVVAIIFVVLLVATGIAEDFFHLDRDAIWAIIVAAFGIFLFFQGFVSLNRKRLIQNIPTSKISALALGLVEVIGRALPLTPKPLKSLYAKVDCVFYRYKVEQFVRTQRHAYWQMISEGSSGVPFYVDDGTGKVLVDPKEARINLETRYISSSPDKKQSVNPLMARTGRMRYTESYIMPEENVYVLGTAKKTRDYVAEHQEKIAKRISDWMKDPEKRKELDTTGDGWFDDVEYFYMREKAKASVNEEEAKKQAQTKVDLTGLADVIIGKGEEEKNFIISTKSEKEITSALGGKTFLFIFGGAALTLVMAIYLLIKFHK